jgi:uncharacterized Tic20 family protein
VTGIWPENLMSEMNSAGPFGGDNETDPDARLWGMMVHLAALAGYLIPFGNLIGPFVIWQIKKDQMPFVDDQGKEAINFQITLMLAMLVAGILVIVLIGFVLMPVLALIALVFIVIAGVKANSGERYRYPFSLRLLK